MQIQNNSACNPHFEWNKIEPKIYSQGLSHTRLVYKSTFNADAPRWVAKLENCLQRDARLLSPLPHSDEIAYKIGKLFRWNTIPKTKILHELAPINNEKYQKYNQLMQYFLNENRQNKLPITFTFQSFMDGETLPNKGELKNQKPDLSSYQKTYLLDVILGKSDARGDNIIYNAITRELFEIDNEYIGSDGYASEGVLNDFNELKQETISEEILQNILSVDLEQLQHVSDKYKKRDDELIDLWRNEPLFKNYRAREALMNEKWGQIFENFRILKNSIQLLKNGDEVISLEKLEKLVKDAFCKIEETKRAAEHEALMKKFMAKANQKAQKALQSMDKRRQTMLYQ